MHERSGVISDWDRIVRSGAKLPDTMERALDEVGFCIIPPDLGLADAARLGRAYDRAMSTADPAEVSVRSSTRLHDFVNRGAEFDPIYIHPLLLAAAARIIERPFKLSSMLGRTLEPGTPSQPLHVDVERSDAAWPLAGFIVMVDAFLAENGATRFVPGSHKRRDDPDEADESLAQGEAVLTACGAAGSIIVFNGSVWHGHSANRSDARRRSIQGAFIPRGAAAATDQNSRILPETLARISELAKYILALPCLPPGRR